MSLNPSTQLRARAPRRCSVCRATGHNARNCPQNCGVHYRGSVFNMYNTPQENLTHFVYNYILEKAPQLNGHTALLRRVLDGIRFHVSLMMPRELKHRLKFPLVVLQHSFIILNRCIEEMRIRQSATQPISVAVINIEVLLDPCYNSDTECFICSEKQCNVKTGCGHEFCAGCVTKIIASNKANLRAPFCSFCKTPFQKFTVSQPQVLTDLKNNI